MPKPAVSAEEFAQWREDPVTQGVLGTLGAMAETQKQGWLEASWEGEVADPLLLKELRTRADAYLALAEGSYEDFFGVSE
jgi:hypothetical protein